MHMNKLKNEIKEYKEFYNQKNKQKQLYHILVNHPDTIILKAIIAAKKYKYYKDNSKNIINKLKMIYFGRKNNKFANRNNIEIYGKIGRKLKIYHSNIVINNNVILGDNVILHGNNCIGNNGKNEKCPRIGNGVEIGFGSIIIGDIVLSDNIVVGANSMVNKSFLEPGITIAGSPAKKVK